MNKLVAVGVWIRMKLPQSPNFIGFTYIDPEYGLSAKGAPHADSELVANPVMTVRPIPFPGAEWEIVGESEIVQLGFPRIPPWADKLGNQPAPGTVWGEWRFHPRLEGKFHPDYPDDLQVLVHDGGPRLTDHRPELVWVRVNGGSGDVFCGRVLNQPEQLTSSAQGSQIHFIVPQNGKYPLSVTEKYLAQRSEWTIHPCNRCGMSELFDPPSELIRIVFPNLPEGTSLETFTAFCGACGGVQAVEKKIYQLPGQTTDKTIAKRKWWKFWA